MKDRAMQALQLLGLEPVAETLADTVSFGFRKYRRILGNTLHVFGLLEIIGLWKKLFGNICSNQMNYKLPYLLHSIIGMARTDC